MVANHQITKNGMTCQVNALLFGMQKLTDYHTLVDSLIVKALPPFTVRVVNKTSKVTAANIASPKIMTGIDI
jgi:hypothetical protein